jgi:hypothetical protein
VEKLGLVLLEVERAVRIKKKVQIETKTAGREVQEPPMRTKVPFETKTVRPEVQEPHMRMKVPLATKTARL